MVNRNESYRSNAYAAKEKGCLRKVSLGMLGLAGGTVALVGLGLGIKAIVENDRKNEQRNRVLEEKIEDAVTEDGFQFVDTYKSYGYVIQRRVLFLIGEDNGGCLVEATLEVEETQDGSVETDYFITGTAYPTTWVEDQGTSSPGRTERVQRVSGSDVRFVFSDYAGFSSIFGEGTDACRTIAGNATQQIDGTVIG